MADYQRHKFHTLDGMRGVAALAVVLHHFRLFGLFAGHSYFLEATLAVDLFFVLSGFVIAFSYDARLASGLTPTHFMAMRFARLAPVIWIGIAIGLPRTLLRGSGTDAQNIVSAILNAMLLPGINSGNFMDKFSSNFPEWSVFFEMFANLIYVVAFPLLRARLLMFIIAVGFVPAIAAVHMRGYVQWPYADAEVWIPVGRVLFGFFLGVALARTRDRWSGSVPAAPAWAVLTATFLLLACPVSGHLRGAYGLSFLAIGSPVLVMLGARSTPSRIGLPLTIQLGALSFPLYAIHGPLVYFGRTARRLYGFSPVTVAVAVLALAIPASLAIALWYEKPAQRRVQRWFGPSIRKEGRADIGTG